MFFRWSSCGFQYLVETIRTLYLFICIAFHQQTIGRLQVLESFLYLCNIAFCWLHLAFWAISKFNTVWSRVFKQCRRGFLSLFEHLNCHFSHFPLCTCTAANVEEVAQFTSVHRYHYVCLGRVWENESCVFLWNFHLQQVLVGFRDFLQRTVIGFFGFLVVRYA